jgi:hypothetical protein
MKRQRFSVVALSVTLFAASVAPASAASSVEWPTRWQVNANGVTGVLEFTIEEDGSLIGRLLDGYVEGYVSGRHLFVRRTSTDRAEVWEGWLGKPRPGEAMLESSLILAGTISVDEAGKTVVYPWFGRPETEALISAVPPPATPSVSPLPSSPPPPPASTAEIAPTAEIAEEPRIEPEPEPIVVEQTPPPAPAPAKAPSDGPLSGTWKTTTGGPARILQDGKKLTVTLADGSLHSGRLTGASTLVVGLRTGCCNGEVESPDVIVWSDGSRWQRAD